MNNSINFFPPWIFCSLNTVTQDRFTLCTQPRLVQFRHQ